MNRILTCFVALLACGPMLATPTEVPGTGPGPDEMAFKQPPSSEQQALAGTTLATMSTPAGDGQVIIDVDGYGSFGYQTFNLFPAGDALYDPVGPVGSSSTSWESGLYFRMTGSSTFLTTGLIGTFSESGALVDPGFSATTPTSASSSFSYAGLNFTLEQSVEDVFVGPDRLGSAVIQVYTITNPTAGTIAFDLLRYYEGDLFLGAGAGVPDGGGHLIVSGEEYVFETDLAGEPADTTNLVGITACGGETPTIGRYEVSEWPDFPERISNDLPLGDVVFLDGPDADEFVDPGLDYDVGIALANNFEIPPGGDALYVTTTVFGTLAPDLAGAGCEEVIQEIPASSPTSRLLVALGLLAGLAIVVALRRVIA